jgi:hypothetical protein
MSGIFSFSRHRFQACTHCRRPVEFDAEVCPHCDRDLVSQRPLTAGRKLVLAGVVGLTVFSASNLFFNGITESISSEANRSVSVTSERMQDKIDRSESRAAKAADTDKANDVSRTEAEKGEARSESSDGGHSLELMLARSCATVRAWACVREHASQALSYDAGDAESQALLEQAIMNSGWKAGTTAAARP